MLQGPYAQLDQTSGANFHLGFALPDCFEAWHCSPCSLCRRCLPSDGQVDLDRSIVKLAYSLLSFQYQPL